MLQKLKKTLTRYDFACQWSISDNIEKKIKNRFSLKWNSITMKFPPVSCQYQHRPLGLRTQQPFQDGILTSSVEIISLSKLLTNNQTTLTTSFMSCNSSRSQPKMSHLHAKLWSHCLIFRVLLRNHKWSATQCSLWECSAVQCAGIDEVSVGIPGNA